MKGDAGFDSTASRTLPRQSSTNARDIPQPGQRRPVTRWNRQRSGTCTEPRTTRGRFTRGRRTVAAKPAEESRIAVAAAAELRLSELLKLHVAKLVNDDHLPLFATGNGHDDPNDAPQTTRKDRDDGVKGVVHRLAFNEDGLVVAL